MGWNDAKDEAERSGGGGLFLKLQHDGEKVKFVIRGEPLSYTRKGFNGAPSKRFLMNVFAPEFANPEDPGAASKVWETNPATFKLLTSLGDEVPIGTNDGEPPQKLVLLKRNGAKGDPSTTYMVLDGGPIDPQVLADMDAAPIHDLHEIARQAIEREGGAPAPRQQQRPAPARQGGPQAQRQGYQRPVNAPHRQGTPVARPANAPAAQRTPAPPEQQPDDGHADSDDVPF